MRMIRCMCGVKVTDTDRFTCNELRNGLGTDDIITMVQRHRQRWYMGMFQERMRMTG